MSSQKRAGSGHIGALCIQVDVRGRSSIDLLRYRILWWVVKLFVQSQSLIPISLSASPHRKIVRACSVTPVSKPAPAKFAWSGFEIPRFAKFGCDLAGPVLKPELLNGPLISFAHRPTTPPLSFSRHTTKCLSGSVGSPSSPTARCTTRRCRSERVVRKCDNVAELTQRSRLRAKKACAADTASSNHRSDIHISTGTTTNVTGKLGNVKAIAAA